MRAGQHGVQATYLHDMGALGYRLGSLDPLITLRDHGITPDYVRELADLGYKGLSATTSARRAITASRRTTFAGCARRAMAHCRCPS